MNAESIMTWLRAVGVPDDVVSIGEEADNCWCLLRDEHAAEDGGVVTWEVFWREQGNRYDWASFSNEQVACHYLFGRLTWAQVSRGAVGVLAEAGEDKPEQAARSTPEPPEDDSPKTGPIVLPQVNSSS
jgi:hypothetical protein